MTTVLTIFLTNGHHVIERFTHLKRHEAIKLAQAIGKNGYAKMNGMTFYPAHSIFKTTLHFLNEPKHPVD